jgi:hypothetical protein
MWIRVEGTFRPADAPAPTRWCSLWPSVCARAAVAASQSVPRVRRRVFEQEWFVASGRGRLEETWAPRQESDSQVGTSGRGRLG